MNQKDIKKLAALGLASGLLLAGESGTLEAGQTGGVTIAGHNGCGSHCGGRRPADRRETALEDTTTTPTPGSINNSNVRSGSSATNSANPNWQNNTNPNTPGSINNNSARSANPNWQNNSGSAQNPSVQNRSENQNFQQNRPSFNERGAENESFSNPELESSTMRRYAGNGCGGQSPRRDSQGCNGQSPRRIAQGGCGGQAPERNAQGCNGQSPRRIAQGGCGGQAPERTTQGCNGQSPRRIAKSGCGGSGCGGQAPKRYAEGGCGGQNPQTSHQNYQGGYIQNGRFIADVSDQAPKGKDTKEYGPYHLYTEGELLDQLNDQGKALYLSLTDEGKALAREIASSNCAGMNACSGRNSCKTATNDCAGKATCKGKSSCGFSDKNQAVAIAAKKMSEKRNNALSK